MVVCKTRNLPSGSRDEPRTGFESKSGERRKLNPTNSLVGYLPHRHKGHASTMNIEVSVVVPAYNRKPFLERTLYFLEAQQTTRPQSIEYIVVDDGSDDGSDEIIRDFERRSSQFKSVYRKRTSPLDFTAAHARNAGIEVARGDILVMLDAGVLVAPDFSDNVISHYSQFGASVGIPRCAGLLLDPSRPFPSLSPELSPSSLTIEANRLQAHPQWKEWREMYFREHNGDLAYLPAPWIFGWSGALVAPTEDIKAIGGYDESATSWGGEDEDLSLRLFRRGLGFRAIDTQTLHLPHDFVPTKEKEKEKSDGNVSIRHDAYDEHYRRRIHIRDQTLDTELLRCVNAWSLNQALQQLETLQLDAVIPQYPERLGQQVLARYGASGTRSLLAGVDSVERASPFTSTDIYTHSKSALRRLTDAFPRRKTIRRIGCDTLLCDNHYEVSVLTDWWRLMGRDMLGAVLRELARVSRDLLVIESPASKGLAPGGPMLIPGAWHRRSDLEEVASMVGLHVEQGNVVEDHNVLIIRGD